MESPLRVSFQGGDSNDLLRQTIVEHVDSLEQLHGRLTACHVTIKVPDKHHRSGGHYSAHIRMTLPGAIEINVDHAPQGDNRFSDPQFAVSDAFRRAKRLIKDHVHKQRGDVKKLHERAERTLDRPD